MKKTNSIIPLIAMSLFISSCNLNGDLSDAYGNFEVDEVLISSQVPGELLEFSINEGDKLSEGQNYGLIDTTDLHLSKLEVRANMEVINAQYTNLSAQINVMMAEKENLEREIARTKKLVESNAATTRQLDDLEGKHKVVLEQIDAIRAQNPAVFSQLEVARAKLDQIDEKIKRSVLTCPANGTVLNKIANTHQILGPGSPLFTMADLSEITLRAYISGDQLGTIKIGDEVQVLIDQKGDEMKEYTGVISWVSSEAEFTPKIIQTKEERVDMVYAIKVRVKNDGFLKIGMPGEVNFSHAED